MLCKLVMLIAVREEIKEGLENGIIPRSILNKGLPFNYYNAKGGEYNGFKRKNTQ